MAEQKYQETSLETMNWSNDIFIVLFLKHIFMSIETDFSLSNETNEIDPEGVDSEGNASNDEFNGGYDNGLTDWEYE